MVFPSGYSQHSRGIFVIGMFSCLPMGAALRLDGKCCQVARQKKREAKELAKAEKLKKRVERWIWQFLVECGLKKIPHDEESEFELR
jgi:hypothetical protein